MIWCVEDDANIREIEVYTLNSIGLEARGFEDGTTLFRALKEEILKLLLLDIMLPDMDGVEILKRLKEERRTKEIPVIMATAKGREYDKIQSLDLGADDYLVKPFGMMEMVSRVKAVLRRSYKEEDDEILELKKIKIHTKHHIVTVDGERITLTFKEYSLLSLFLKNAGKAISREQIFQDVWGESYIGESRTLDAHIRSLRTKLGDSGNLIQTVRNVGYRMEVMD